MQKQPGKLPADEYRSIYSRVPRLCVDLLIRNEHGVLLIKREIDPGKGLWHFPGGTLLRGERIEAAAVRIALEETNLSVTGLKLVGTMEFAEEDNLFFHTISLVYSAGQFSGQLQGGTQGKELAFFTILPDGMIPEHKDLLNSI